MSFEPNREDTCYVLSLSYGKDSIACIEACKQLGWRIDRIVHAEVWATDDISADLPPMVEFKKYADKVIKERYGLDVEHICAMCTPDKKVNFQKPLKVMGYTNAPTKTSFTERERTNNTEESGTDSLAQEGLGATVNSKSKCCKLTYQDIFYRPLSPRSKMIQKAIERERENLWISNARSPLVYRRTQAIGNTDFQINGHDGVRGNSKIFIQAPKTRCRHKYRFISWNCSG